LFTAFLSEERNESYLLLGDAGVNLHASRERGEVSPNAVRRHALSVLRALAHVHASGVVHRDVKGGNVLVGVDGEFFLIPVRAISMTSCFWLFLVIFGYFWLFGNLCMGN
jgi:serine/threonine protein kinase